MNSSKLFNPNSLARRNLRIPGVNWWRKAFLMLRFLESNTETKCKIGLKDQRTPALSKEIRVLTRMISMVTLWINFQDWTNKCTSEQKSLDLQRGFSSLAIRQHPKGRLGWMRVRWCSGGIQVNLYSYWGWAQLILQSNKYQQTQ